MQQERDAYIRFFPTDWDTDKALKLCSLAAQGLWVRMLCIMHEGEPYGHLSIQGQGLSTGQLAELVGKPEKEVAPLVRELEQMSVFSKSDEGVPFSRRLVRDMHKRRVRKAAGSKGGKVTQANAKDFAKANTQANLQAKIKPHGYGYGSSSLSVFEGGAGETNENHSCLCEQAQEIVMGYLAKVRQPAPDSRPDPSVIDGTAAENVVEVLKGGEWSAEDLTQAVDNRAEEIEFDRLNGRNTVGIHHASNFFHPKRQTFRAWLPPHWTAPGEEESEPTLSAEDIAANEEAYRQHRARMEAEQ